MISALFIVQSFPKWFVHFWMTFCKNSIRISCQIIFVNKHWPQSCLCPFKSNMINIHTCSRLVYQVNGSRAEGLLRAVAMVIMLNSAVPVACAGKKQWTMAATLSDVTAACMFKGPPLNSNSTIDPLAETIYTLLCNLAIVYCLYNWFWVNYKRN